MPTYQYRCTECGHAMEVHQAFTDDALTICPECQGRLRKIFNAVGVVFKGSGFYRNDAREADAKAAASASSQETSATSNGSSDGSGSGSAESTSTSSDSASGGQSSGQSGSQSAGQSGGQSSSQTAKAS